MQKIISVAVPKGGVGKTTSAVNLAASLAVIERKTLLIDFDPSGSCSTYLGVKKDSSPGSIFDVFTFKKALDKVIHPTDLPNLDFIPAKIDTLEMEERISRISNHTTIFTNILNKYEVSKYDFIIIDCPPYLKGLTTVAISTSNSILIPIKAGQFSITALDKMMDYIKTIKDYYNPRLEIEGILLTMYEVNTKAWTKTEEELNKRYKDMIFETIIPKNISLTEAEFYGKPAILFSAKSTGAEAYLQLAKEVVEKNKELENRFPKDL